VTVARLRLPLQARRIWGNHVSPCAPFFLRAWGTSRFPLRRRHSRNYCHPAGTCPLGEVVDLNGRVLGAVGLVVADASIMPTIPRANTNLTTAAIAERIATSFD
jgi:choline dehydrogenase-like flavoprotein